MKAILDHIGIAVADLPAALAFYRDALGLEVQVPEEVASQRIRAHLIPAGEAALELLEATAADSPIAKFLGSRGPGLHHVTLRVENITAALQQVKTRGVRVIDEVPRPGAHGALVAFIHPSSAHGVLIELTQGTPSTGPVVAPPRFGGIARYVVGDVEIVSLSDGFFALDGGAMFGVVPKTLWERKAQPDGRNRIPLGMRPLLVRGARTLLIDAGVGDKDDAKFADIYGLDRARHLDHAMAEAGVSPEDIDIVLASHLHFDHAGGFTVRDGGGAIRPRFPKAQYVVRRGEWEAATHPNERNRASYLVPNYVPLADAGVLQLVDADATIMPGVRVRRTGGHTMHHQMVLIESGGRTAVFVADLIPTVAHVPGPWIMGYDLYPMDTLAAKKAFVREAIEGEYLILFEHEPLIPAAYLREKDGKTVIDPVQGR